MHRTHSASQPTRPQDPHAHYDSPSIMFSYLAHSNPYHHFHLFPSNPYPPPTPPPPIAHKVWILDCKSCGAFLTNRGMKAVLLLRPNVALYSSDALPVNCSAHSPDPHVARPRSGCPDSSPAPARTCECLTQTLCCHGCGSTVGYMIVIPCARCTSSITTTNRATNGHRFVFHSSEIAGTERHYIQDEPGIIPYEPPNLIATPPRTIPSHHPLIYPLPYMPTPRDSPAPSSMSYSRSSSPSVHSEYSSTPSLEYANPIIAATASLVNHDPYYDPLNHPTTLLYQTYTGPQYRHALSPHPLHSPPLSPPNLANPLDPSGLPQDRKEPPTQRHLEGGDVLFWHHLARSGEIPGVQDDERARGPITPEFPDVKPVNISFGR